MILKESDELADRRPKRSVASADVEPGIEAVIASEQRFAGLALEAQPSSGGHNLVEVQADDTEVEAVNREEEIVKKRKTELTTTRQIETRVKRQLLFEDGKVVEDSGPIVSTNTTEDTDKQETVQTEHRTLGDPVTVEGESGLLLAGTGPDTEGDSPPQQQQQQLPAVGGIVAASGQSEPGASLSSTAVPKTIGIAVARADGLLRTIKEEVVVSREETKERTEVTEQKQFGDFTDDAYLRAINSGVDDIRELLLSERAHTELSPSGPQLVHQTISSRKVVDSEDTDIRHLARPDGTLVTEKQQTRQHEELYDDELPETDAGHDQLDNCERLIEKKSSAQRYYKQRDEQHVDLVAADGEVIGHDMRYAAEQTLMEKDCVGREGPAGVAATAVGDAGLLSDWDSLSDRLRKARRLNRHTVKETVLLGSGGGGGGFGGVLGAAAGVVPTTLNDRLDALTKKPLDFDKEEETRKQETSKWLESHFGSESRSSRDSREDLDELVEPTKKTYFNVTIKSTGDGVELAPTANRSVPELGTAHERGLYSSIQQQQQHQQRQMDGPKSVVPREGAGSKAAPYYQGISEWSAAAGSRSQPYAGRGTMGDSREDMLLLGEGRHAVLANGASERSSDGVRTDYRDLELPADGEYRQGATAHITAHRPLSGRAGSGEQHFAARYGHSVSPDRDSQGNRHAGPDTTRPLVPQRRKVLERRQQQQQHHQQHQQHQQQLSVAQYHGGKPVVHHEYLSAPRSRSISPIQIPPVASTLRKPYQKTRFSSIQDLSWHASSQQSLGHQHQQPPPRTTSRAQSTPPKANRVGSAIGNSIRKLMGKIRSASAERKHKSGSKGTKQQQHQQQHQYQHQLRSQSPTSSTLQTAHVTPGQHKRHSTATYQQYNVIDEHISSNDSPLFSQRHHHSQQQLQQLHHYSQQLQYAGDEQRSLGGLAGSHKSNGIVGRRDSERERPRERRSSSDIISDMTTGSGGAGGGPTPRQKYYLGENPYGGSIFGKENKYNAAAAAAAAVTAAGRERRDDRNYASSHTRSFSQPPTTANHTLGRFSKSTNRLSTAANGGSGQYEPDPGLPYATDRQTASGFAVSSQTLPRNDHHRLQRFTPLHSSTINVSIVNTVSPGAAAKSTPGAEPLVNTGPVKPARTYKALNRSKSFNVHGLNGTNDPSPIYLEKLGRGQPTAGSGGVALYRANFHHDTGSNQQAPRDASVHLKSPSIVNQISRSTRDLTQTGQYEDAPAGSNRVLEYIPGGGAESTFGPHTLDKKNVFLRNLQNRAPELYRTLHGAELSSESSSPSKEYLGSYITREQGHLLGSRMPATLTKDTASIVRRGSSSAEECLDAANAPKTFYRKPTSRGLQSLETEGHTTVSSRYRGDSDLKYQDVHASSNISGNGTVDGVVIELRSNS